MYAVVVIGAGAAGFMAAITAAKLGNKVVLIDHGHKTCEKIRISGGGRCNFTNVNAAPENYISQNPHFVKSALAQYSAQDFIDWVEDYGIEYHEKKLGQLFCNESSQQIINMLLSEADKYGVEFWQGVSVKSIEKEGDAFTLAYQNTTIKSRSVIIATGGLSIPATGTSDFGYRIARKFGLKIIEPKPALVPLKFSENFFLLNAGLSFHAQVSCSGKSFTENILFTHKGLSGPAILQISSYWQQGQEIIIDICPHIDLKQTLFDAKTKQGAKSLKTILKNITYPETLHSSSKTKLNRNNVFTQDFLETFPLLQEFLDLRLAEISKSDLEFIASGLNAWTLEPSTTEGFAKAEVTIGGLATEELDSKTMQVKKIPGLFFIGEVVDVTGWLGGYNFQWAWSSGYVAGYWSSLA